MKEIVPGIWTWSIFNAEKGLNFNGWYVRSGGEAVVIDPPPPTSEVLSEIKQRGRPVAVLLTNKHHARASETFRKEFDAPIWVHENDKPLMDIQVDRTFKDSELLPCSLKAVTLKSGKTPGETAFVFEGSIRALIVGDAIIGKPAGSLSMLPPEKFRDQAAAKEGLKVLLQEEFEVLLLGDGESIPRNGKKALQMFLK